MSTFPAALHTAQPEAPRPTRGRGSSMREWRLLDRIVLGAAWAAGLGLCLVTGAIVVYMGVRGFQYLRPDLLVSRPLIAEDGSVSGGILDPLIGTVVLTAIGLVVALTLGV
jgi:phosphate transport system permease protein